MKTTLVLPDDIFRQAKARAALRGQTFGKFLEQGLRQMLQEPEETPSQASLWVRQLPRVSPSAAAELEEAVNASDFRQVDAAMW
jgi:plasmid stability protein